MKTMLTKVIAVMMVVVMMMTFLPVSVLAELLPTAIPDLNGDGVIDAADEDIFASVSQGKVYDSSLYSDGTTDSFTDGVVNDQYSPYEPYSTNDENHPFLTDGSAWIDLKQIYYGAPATPNYPLTKWSANTSVYNITGTGEKYECGCTGTDADNDGNCDNHGADGQEVYSLPDLNLIDEKLWADKAVEVYKDHNVPEGTTADGTDDEGDYIWVKQDGVAHVNDNKGTVDSASTIYTDATHTVNTVEPKTDGTAAYVYNRYDAMQGKWGLTLDKNVSSVVWSPSWKPKYFGDSLATSTIDDEYNLDSVDLNSSWLYLSDTPYLYYSTEALDTTQIAISLLIGAPVQSETMSTYAENDYQSWVANRGDYEYRWYTITDNKDRPGIEGGDYDMTPNVYISDVVLKEVDNDTTNNTQTLSLVMNNILNGYTGAYTNTTYAADPDKLDPIKWAAEENKDNADFSTESLYVSGSITGCIDFTNLLPLVMGTLDSASDYTTHGSQDVKYKIAQIRVDTKTVDGKEDSAARINYLYFGPGLSTIYTPQNTVGNDVNAANWMYGQYDDGLGDQNANNVAGLINSENQWACSYTSGWENGQAVSITNTPNNPQLITIDTYGKNGDGQLITYEQYASEDEAGKAFTKGSQDIGNANWQETSNLSRVWKYTDSKGNVQYLEAEYNENDENYYIMVTIPVRKWIDVLGTARKLSLTMTVLQYSRYTDSDGNVIQQLDESGNVINPSFGLWGNNAGCVGGGHSGWDLTTRFRHENILGIFGTGYYQVDNADNFKAAEVDKTLGDSTIYNTGSDNTESWFDLLRSPYMLDETVKSASAEYYYGSEMIGYCFVTAMRFAVPVGTKFTVQNMKGDGNSAGLNMYSTTGAIVNAYDGGTGAQPEVNTNNTLTEPAASFTTEVDKNGDDKLDGYDAVYSYDTYADNVVKGTQTKAAAAYGPFLDTSYYTIYDLIDTEKLNAGGTGSNAKLRQGLEEQKIYGKVYQNLTDQRGYFPILTYPHTAVTYTSTDSIATWLESSESNNIKTIVSELQTSFGFTFTKNDTKNWNPVLGYTYNAGTEIIVYAGVHFLEQNEIWGVVGVLTADGTPKNGWVLLANGEDNAPENGQTWYFQSSGENNSNGGASAYGYLYDGNLTLDEDEYDYYVYHSRTEFESAVAAGGAGGGDEFIATLKENLCNEWIYSNAIGSFTDFLSANSSDGTKWNDISDHAGTAPQFNDIYVNGPQLSYSNMWAMNHDTQYTNQAGVVGRYSSSNSKYNVADWKVTAENTTDMKITVNPQDVRATYGSWSVGISRTFDKPINLIANDYRSKGNYDYPAFYYDFSCQDFAADLQTNRFGLTVKVTDSAENVLATDLWWLNSKGQLERNAAGVDAGDGGENSDGATNSVWGYVDLQSMMDYYAPKDASGNIIRDANNQIAWPTIQIVGFNMYVYLAQNAKNGDTAVNDLEVTIRRMEIWQVETTWLDEITNGVTHDSGKTVVADSMNIINDAFFNIHNENADGVYTLTPVDTNGDGNRDKYTVEDTLNNVSYDDVANSYRKGNSNKGWTAWISTDSDGNGKIDSNDTILHSYQSTSEEGIYEYRSSLGHLRVWVPANQQASVIFTADRSFNTDNYRYLYYSYSVRDQETGIAAEDNADGGNTGVEVAIKSYQNGSDRAYVERNGTWVFYDEGVYYWSNEGHDNRDYATNMCAAVDLSTCDGIDSVNQLVFYLNSGKTEGYSEFYINYVYLSNVAPAGAVAEELQDTQVQYYYMMDNTGDRYSARFPTLDNPTGQVTGFTNNTDRVNPIVVERGALLQDGNYLNGESLKDYATDVEKYDKTYGTTVADTLLKEIWFYAGESDAVNDITDFYQYKDRFRLKDTDGAGVIETVDPDGDGNIYDMLWSYGRWFTGEGESGRNMMYVVEPGQEREGETQDTVSGNLSRRYATENYVLLRSGIEPKQDLTYYDTQGGQFYYSGSSDSLGNDEAIGSVENVYTYYTTKTVLFSYFSRPTDYGFGTITPVKYGFDFDGWWYFNDLDGDTLRDVVKVDGDTTVYPEDAIVGDCEWVNSYTGNQNSADGSDATIDIYVWRDADKDGVIDDGEVTDWQGDVVTYNAISSTAESWDAFKAEGGTLNDGGIVLTGPGCDTWSDINKDGNMLLATEEELELHNYDTKLLPGVDYFYAKWTPSDSYADTVHTATFYNGGNTADTASAWLTNTAKQANEFKVKMPSVFQMKTADGVKSVAGWKAYYPKTDGNGAIKYEGEYMVPDWDNAYTYSDADGKTITPVYNAATKITLKADMVFVPVFDDANTSNGFVTVTVSGAKLWLSTGASDENGNPIGLMDPATQNIGYTVTGEGGNTYTYTKVPRNLVFVAKPTEETLADSGEYLWEMPYTVDGSTVNWNPASEVVSRNESYYKFVATGNMTLNYAIATETTKLKDGAFAGVSSIVPDVTTVNREMKFYGQYQNVEGYTVVAAGMLYAKGPENYTSVENVIRTYMALDETSINADTISVGSFKTLATGVIMQAMTQVATENTNQYYLSYTESQNETVTMYMRSYAIYLRDGTTDEYEVVYSNFVASDTVEAVATLTVTEET